MLDEHVLKELIKTEISQKLDQTLEKLVNIEKLLTEERVDNLRRDLNDLNRRFY